MSGELIEQLFLPAFGGGRRRRARRLRRARRAGAAAGWRSRPTRSWSSRCSSPAARSATWRSTAPSTTWRCPGRRRCSSRPRSSSPRAPRWPTSAGSRRRSARRPRPAGVQLVTGDTKVVDSGSGDGVFVNTAGIGRGPGRRRHRPAPGRGRRRRDRQRRHRRARHRGDELPGGPGVRHHRSRATPRRCTGWSPTMLATGVDVHVLRDPTRGGVSATLNEIARASGVGIELVERDLPDPGRGQGRLRAARARPAAGRQRGQAARDRPRRPAPTRCSPRCARTRSAPGPRRIGSCVAEHPRMVVARTGLGGTRVVDLPIGEQLPRIC